MNVRCGQRWSWGVVCCGLLLALQPESAWARVRLENICTIYGQKEIKLTGMGLVVGLKGSGDGSDNLPAMRALAAALKLQNNPVVGFSDLSNADNVALVFIDATIPKTGLRRGQRIDCYVSSPFGAKSLRGGRLLVSPVETAEIGDDTLVGLAAGAVVMEDAETPTTGKIPNGIVLEENFVSHFVDTERGHVITLLLDEAHSSFHASSEVARVVNTEFSTETNGKYLARAVEPGVVDVVVPNSYYDSLVDFVALMLEINIDNPHTEARVIVNAKTGVVVVTGEVEISPVIISHKNLTIEVGGNLPAETIPGRFVPIFDQTNRQSPQQLQQLVDSLNRLRVPTSDIINIIRELKRSGKLHAMYEER